MLFYLHVAPLDVTGKDYCVGIYMPDGSLSSAIIGAEVMRDPERIERVIKKLEKLWHLVPDWRLGQLISNLLGPGPHDVFFLEDDEWEELIDKAMLFEEPEKK